MPGLREFDALYAKNAAGTLYLPVYGVSGVPAVGKVPMVVDTGGGNLDLVFTALSAGSGLVFDPTFKFKGTVANADYVDLVVKGFAFAIQSWAIYESTGAASAVVDILKADWAGTPAFSSMVGGSGNKPTLSSARTNEADVADWTTVTVDGTSTTQILRAQVSGAPTGVANLTLALKVQRST